MSTLLQGKKWETEACEYLLSEGYHILERNWRSKHLEIDIIASRGVLLVIVEVKGRLSDAFGEPVLMVSAEKKRRILRAADAYLQAFPWDGEVRFDIIGILEETGDLLKIQHIEDAFDVIS